jgi:hypothetical protein
VVAMVYMPRTWLKHGPANHVIGTGGFLVDQKLHLHIDPAVIALEAINLRYIAQICAVHNWRFVPKADILQIHSRTTDVRFTS